MLRYWFARFGALILMTMTGLPVQAASSTVIDPSQKLFVSLGQNLSWASLSDIHFKGEGYDFTLHDVASHDDLQFDSHLASSERSSSLENGVGATK